MLHFKHLLVVLCSLHSLFMGAFGLGGEAIVQEEELGEKLILFSGNDYMGLSSHLAIREAAAKVCNFCTGSDR